jgi:hypothetical protein
MRKIEQELLEAIKTRTNWSKSNSQVSFHNDKCYVYLHGHNIAVLDYVEDNITEIKLYSQGYLTKTTKSILNIVLELATKHTDDYIYYYNLYQQSFNWYLKCIKCSKAKEVIESTTTEFTEGISIKVE